MTTQTKTPKTKPEEKTKPLKITNFQTNSSTDKYFHYKNRQLLEKFLTKREQAPVKDAEESSILGIITINGKAQQIHIMPQGTFKDPYNTAVKKLMERISRGEVTDISKTIISQKYNLTIKPNEDQLSLSPREERDALINALAWREHKEKTNPNKVNIAVSENGKEDLLYLALTCNGNMAGPRLEIDEIIAMLNTRGTINSRKSELVNEDTPNEKYLTIISYSPDYTTPASKLQQAQIRVGDLELEVENANAIILELLHKNQEELKAKESILELISKTPTKTNATILDLLDKTQDALKDPVIKGYAKCKRISPRIIEEGDFKKAMDIYLDALYDNLKAETKITEKQVTSSTKDTKTTGHRALFMFLMRSRFGDKGASFPYIGQLMGNKNHATVILACQRVSNNGKIILPFETTGDAKVDYDNVIGFYNERNPNSKFIKKLSEKGHFSNLNLST